MHRRTSGRLAAFLGAWFPDPAHRPPSPRHPNRPCGHHTPTHRHPSPPQPSPSTTIQYTYDAEGNPTGRLVAPGQTNLGLQTNISYDSLQHPTKITDPGAGTTQLGYARASEHLSSVTDPRRLTTHYDKDGQGQTQLQQSPDSDQSLLRFDAAGNLTQHLDARGALSQYTYDALNRLTSATHSLSAAASVSQRWVYDQRPATGQAFMSNRRTSSDSLRLALKCAKNGEFQKAQAIAAMIEKDLLPTKDLRNLALIHSYCGLENDAVQIWQSICEREDVATGDHFMLSSTQIGLGNFHLAIENLRLEIKRSDQEGNSAYFSVSALSLAFLLIRNDPKNKAEAWAILNRLDNSESTYIVGAGLVTKLGLAEELKR